MVAVWDPRGKPEDDGGEERPPIRRTVRHPEPLLWPQCFSSAVILGLVWKKCGLLDAPAGMRIPAGA
ncbi:hypothetical protein, partial [Shinella sp. BYT-45]|uniref:hypothetical protein n=1 Tax=Shinella sp. BYT-45 TaxID=3377377 RepID=UPI0039817710